MLETEEMLEVELSHFLGSLWEMLVQDGKKSNTIRSVVL